MNTVIGVKKYGSFTLLWNFTTVDLVVLGYRFFRILSWASCKKTYHIDFRMISGKEKEILHWVLK